MSWSLGEIHTLCVKAARGAGMPWGLAEEAGFAVSWLEERSLPGAQALAGYLGSNQKFDAASCPLSRGAGISDTGDWKGFEPARIRQPLLLVPFLASVTGDETVEARWDNCSVRVDAIGVSGTDGNLLCDEMSDVSLIAGKGDINAHSAVTRVPDDRQAFVSLLGKFAHKTYAPSTEESRAKGAGAGLTDND